MPTPAAHETPKKKLINENSPNKKSNKNKKCNEQCDNTILNLNTRVKSLEKEKADLTQKIQNIEKHQETLRGTIDAQKSLIKEQEISTQVHNNIAMMFLDEMVDDGESITVLLRSRC